MLVDKLKHSQKTFQFCAYQIANENLTEHALQAYAAHHVSLCTNYDFISAFRPVSEAHTTPHSI